MGKWKTFIISKSLNLSIQVKGRLVLEEIGIDRKLGTKLYLFYS